MLKYLLDAKVVSQQAYDAAVHLVGEPHRLESLDKLIDQAQKGGAPAGVSQLYDRVYRPASAFFSHGSGLSFLRHVSTKDRLRSRPAFPWAKHSPAHTADASVGLLASLMAGSEHSDFKLFSKYADRHWAHVAPIVAAIGGKGMVRALHPPKVHASIQALRRLVLYFDSGASRSDSDQTRRERVRRDFITVFACFGDDHDETIVDAFVEMLITDGPLGSEDRQK